MRRPSRCIRGVPEQGRSRRRPHVDSRPEAARWPAEQVPHQRWRGRLPPPHFWHTRPAQSRPDAVATTPGRRHPAGKVSRMSASRSRSGPSARSSSTRAPPVPRSASTSESRHATASASASRRSSAATRAFVAARCSHARTVLVSDRHALVIVRIQQPRSRPSLGPASARAVASSATTASCDRSPCACPSCRTRAIDFDTDSSPCAYCLVFEPFPARAVPQAARAGTRDLGRRRHHHRRRLAAQAPEPPPITRSCNCTGCSARPAPAVRQSAR